jgi:hypothetical protein
VTKATFPMVCACCRVNRHDLCGVKDEISFCACECHPVTPRVIHASDITVAAFDRDGRALDCAPTREQYLSAAAVTDHIHFVRNQEHTGGGE